MRMRWVRRQCILRKCRGGIQMIFDIIICGIMSGIIILLLILHIIISNWKDENK